MQEVFMIPSRKIFRNILSSLLHHSYLTVVLCHANTIHLSVRLEKMLASVSVFNSRPLLRSVEKLHRMKKWCIWFWRHIPPTKDDAF